MELRAFSKENEISIEIPSEVLCTEQHENTTSIIRLDSEILEKYFINESKEEINQIIKIALEEHYQNKIS